MRSVRLQLALDFPAAIGVVPGVVDLVDVIEVGTPLLKRLGVAAITIVRELAPQATIVADSKTVDGGFAEASMLFAAGADMVTVLSEAPSETWDAVDRAAVEFRRSVMIDTILAVDPVEAAGRPWPTTFTHIAVHVPTDARMAGSTTSEAATPVLKRMPRHLALVAAGGIGPRNLPAILGTAPDVVIVGRAITTDAEPRRVAETIAKMMETA